MSYKKLVDGEYEYSETIVATVPCLEIYTEAEYPSLYL